MPIAVWSLEQSLNYIKQAVSLEPTNGAYLDSLGWAYFKLGKYDQAEENLTKAALHMGSDPTVQDHLGDLYQKTGRLKLAAAHWDRAVAEWNKTVPRKSIMIFSRPRRKNWMRPKFDWQKKIQSKRSRVAVYPCDAER